jgi:AcrR family transcriptional regulator
MDRQREIEIGGGGVESGAATGSDQNGSEAAAGAVLERPRGRPRRPATEEDVLHATVSLLAEVGLAGTTIRAISERSGVARATIYLRWPTRDAVIAAALRHAIGRDPYPLTGDIEHDIRRGGEESIAVLSEPAFAAVLPALARGLLTRDGDSGEFEIDYDTLFPNRRLIAEEYRALAGEQGFRTDVDADLVVDLLTGAPMSYMFATGEPPPADVVEELVDFVLDALRDPDRRDGADRPA